MVSNSFLEPPRTSRETTSGLMPPVQAQYPIQETALTSQEAAQRLEAPPQAREMLFQATMEVFLTGRVSQLPAVPAVRYKETLLGLTWREQARYPIETESGSMAPPIILWAALTQQLATLSPAISR